MTTIENVGGNPPRHLRVFTGTHHQPTARLIMRSPFRVIPAALLLALNCSPAWAQGTKAAPQNNPSDKLNQSGGVIAPRQDVDPKMQITPPDPGPASTPVIPPPGSPGGNPNVVPK
jgi:hypothetical protein